MLEFSGGKNLFEEHAMDNLSYSAVTLVFSKTLMLMHLVKEGLWLKGGFFRFMYVCMYMFPKRKELFGVLFIVRSQSCDLLGLRWIELPYLAFILLSIFHIFYFAVIM